MLTDRDKNNYSHVFVPSADFGHFSQIKQTAKLQYSEKIMYSHFEIRHVARVLLLIQTFFHQGENRVPPLNHWGAKNLLSIKITYENYS